jgi:hypothetical protein
MKDLLGAKLVVVFILLCSKQSTNFKTAPQTSLKPFRVRGLKVSTLQASTAWDKTSKNVSTLSRALSIKGFKVFQGNQ